MCVCVQAVSTVESREEDGGDFGGSQSRRRPPWSQPGISDSHWQRTCFPVQGRCIIK